MKRIVLKISCSVFLLASGHAFSAPGAGSLQMQLQYKAAYPTLKKAYDLAQSFLVQSKDFNARTGQVPLTGKFRRENRRFLVFNAYDRAKGTMGAWVRVKNTDLNPAVTHNTLVYVYAMVHDKGKVVGAYNKTDIQCDTNADKRLQETTAAHDGTRSVLLPHCRYIAKLSFNKKSA